MNFRNVPVEELRPHPDNPRLGNTEMVASMIKSRGILRWLIVQESTGYVIAGAHTLEAAKSLGYTEVPCCLLDADDAQARKIMLADNRTTDLATYNRETLSEVLKGITSLESVGFSSREYGSLVAQTAPDPKATGLTRDLSDRIVIGDYVFVPKPDELAELHEKARAVVGEHADDREMGRELTRQLGVALP